MFLFSTVARAQDAPPPDGQSAIAPQSEMDEAKANLARMTARPAYKSGPDPDFSESEKALGHHGIVTISGIVGVDGRLHYAKIQKGSGAPVLDQSALIAYQAAEWMPARDFEGKSIAVPISVPLEFYSFRSKAAGGGLPLYKCRQFVLDMDWWKATFPQAKWSDHELYRYTSGLLLLSRLGTKRSLDGATADFDKRWTSAIETCRSHPDRRFLDQFPLR
jgi:TonB family protein